MMRRRNTPATETNKQATTRSFLKSEWPLFLYPALVVAAIVLLQAVHQSIEKDLTPSQRQADPSASQTTATTEQNDQNTSQARLPEDGSTLPPDALVPLPDTGVTDTTLAADRLRMIEALRRRAEWTGSGDSVGGGDLPQELQAVHAILTSLRQAVRDQDHSRIKEAMEELVALGDEVVGPLSDIVAGGTDEAALWAAEALARIGTPAATAALFETLAQIEQRESRGVTQVQDLAQMIRVLNDTKKNNRFYVRLLSQDPGAVVNGEALPSLPPSVLSVLEGDRSGGSFSPLRKRSMRSFMTTPPLAAWCRTSQPFDCMREVRPVSTCRMASRPFTGCMGMWW